MAIVSPVATKESSVSEKVKNIVLILCGIFSAGLGLKGFLLSSHFIDGGVTGISMLVAQLSGIPLYILILFINLPFIILGYRQMGWRFSIKSAVAIAGLAICLAIIPFPDITPDKLLTAVFGGVFIGVGIGLAMRGEAKTTWEKAVRKVETSYWCCWL